MKFAKIVFWAASIWGVLVLAPLLFMFDLIGQKDPPPITHPAFYYGFVSVALVWQVAFMVIATNPVRYRMMMIPAVLEKFGYGTVLVTLFLQNRLHPQDLVFGVVDTFLGILFLVSFFKTAGSAHTP